MNKTYIANENHPFLKKGVEIIFWRGKWRINESACDMGNLEIMSEPAEKPDWYDEVKEEKSIEELWHELAVIHRKLGEQQIEAHKRLRIIEKQLGR